MVDAQVRTRLDADSVVVEVCGDLDGPSVAQLRHVLVDAVLRRRPPRVVLDLERVTGIDAVGIGTLLGGCDAALDLGIAVLIRDPGSLVTQRLQANGLPPACLLAS